jgi:hypothetical protein
MRVPATTAAPITMGQLLMMEIDPTHRMAMVLGVTDPILIAPKMRVPATTAAPITMGQLLMMEIDPTHRMAMVLGVMDPILIAPTMIPPTTELSLQSLPKP